MTGSKFPLPFTEATFLSQVIQRCLINTIIKARNYILIALRINRNRISSALIKFLKLTAMGFPRAINILELLAL